MRVEQIDNDKHNDTLVVNDSENDNYATIVNVKCQYHCATVVRCHVVVS